MTVAPTNQEREARAARERLKRYTARQQVHEHQQKRRRRDNLLAVLSVVVVVGLAIGAQVLFFTAGPGAPEPVPSAEADATDSPEDTATGENVGDVPDPELAEARTWTGTMTLNDVELGIELDGAAAPQAVAVFVDEVETDYFVDTTCHRLVRSASAGLIQCGSADGTGATDPTFGFGPIENAPEDQVYPAGTIAMARAGDDAFSNGRQFFIVFEETTLPNDSAGGYTVMGTVTSGLDTLVSDIADAGIEPAADGSESNDGAPVVPTTITSVTLQ